jgi:hypothetical protein
MGKRRGAYRLSVGNMRERDHLENLGIDGDNIKIGLKKYVGIA